MNVVWTPQPKQIEFLSRPEYECLYGGAAGGGKSEALVAEALRQVEIPHYKGLILRKTYPQLLELIDKTLNIYPRVYPGARYNASQHYWTFPSGAKILFGSMHTENAKYNYQGQAYDFIGFDELTHFTYEEYMYLISRNRPNGPGTRVYVRATANPGGIGHGWVKERFITPAPPNTTIWEAVDISLPDGGISRGHRSRIFIPASVFDNKILLDNDPNYIASLALLPKAERDALLYGNWDSFSGQVFVEWRNDPANYDSGRWTHVITPFRIPDHWRIYRSFDFGYSKPFSVGWYAADTGGKIYRIREYYGCQEANVGVKMNPREIAQHIKEIESQDVNLKGKKIIGIADPAIFEESKGESIASMMEASPYFISFSKADNSRLAGKMQVHYRLAFDDMGGCMFQVFSTCRHFIRTIPNLVYDDRDVEDVDTDGEDHIYDETRYIFMERPISPRVSTRQTLPLDDPLDMFADKRAEDNSKYAFYRL